MTSEHQQILSKLYADAGVPLDRLPYTAVFDKIYMELLCETGSPYKKEEVWTTLVHLRKSGKLPRMRRKQGLLFDEN